MYDNRFFMQCFFSADSIPNKKMLKTSALKRSQQKKCYLQIDEVHLLMKD